MRGTPAVVKLLPIAVLALSLGGCRSKAYESFIQATTPNPPLGNSYGDPYLEGGIAAADGGTRPGVRYGMGSDPAGRPEVGYDTPAKGSGLQPGEEPPSGRPWWATSNAPIGQAGPGALDANGTRVKN